MANSFITPDKMAQDLLASIQKTAKDYGVSEVDLFNAVSGHFFHASPMQDEPESRLQPKG